MKFISHRGNLNGSFSDLENNPNYIDNTIQQGYEVEIDVWCGNNNLRLGHDEPCYSVNVNWFLDRRKKLWIHCKNIAAIEYFKNKNDFNFFWHENDTMTLTSLGYIWVFPGKQPVKKSIAVMPEIYNDNISEVIGICSDHIEKYRVMYDSNSDE